jgi:hypothetical protein
MPMSCVEAYRASLPKPVQDTRDPNIRIKEHCIFQGHTVYTKGDLLHYNGDIVFLLALADPIPGSMTADFVSRCARNIPKIEPIYALSLADRQRLSRLRRDLSELSEAQLNAEQRLREMLLAHAESLG